MDSRTSNFADERPDERVLGYMLIHGDSEISGDETTR
jgi:hypothetical protein